MSRICNTCQKEREDLLQCSKCKQRYYCDINCQRSNWPSHKLECKTLLQQATIPQQTNTETTIHRCPYRPEGPSKTGGVCPFRDLAEESELQVIIDKDLKNGMEGMLELGGLAKSTEMSMQIPLQKTVVKVLKLIEKFESPHDGGNGGDGGNGDGDSMTNSESGQQSIEYLNAMATFISNMLQWEHNEFIKHERYERLASIAIKNISQYGDICAFKFGKILFWLHGCDRSRFLEVLGSYPLDQLELVKSSIQRVSIESEWQERAKLWNIFVSKFVEYVERSHSSSSTSS